MVQVRPPGGEVMLQSVDESLDAEAATLQVWFGRTVVPEKEAPTLLANLVLGVSAVVQGDNASEHW